MLVCALAACHRKKVPAGVDQGVPHADAAEAASESPGIARKVMGDVKVGERPAAFCAVRLGTPGHVRSVVADEDGHFELGAVAPGAYAIAASDKGLAAFTGVDVGIDPQQPLVVEVKLQLEPTAPLAGIVRGAGGRPLAGALVRVEETERPLPLELETKADGRVVADERIKGRAYRVTVRRAGYLSDGPRLVRAGGPPFDVQLLQGATLEGTVVDESGAPVVNAELAVIGTVEGQTSEEALPIPVTSGNTGGGWTRLQTSGELGVLTGGIPYPPLDPAPPSAAVNASAIPHTDAKGHFVIAELPAGKVVVTARHPDFAGGTSVPLVLVGGETRTVRLELSRGARIAGRVLDERSLGIADAQVTTSDGRTVLSDSGGRFTVEHAFGHLTLSVRRQGFLRGEGTLEISGGQREAVIDLVLHRALGHLGGDVRDPGDRPVAGARLTIVPPGSAHAPGEPMHATTDGAGRFLVEGMPDGPYRVTVEHVDFARLQLGAVEANVDAHLVLRLGGGLDGELYDPRTGRAPVDVHLQWVSGDDKRQIPVEGRRFRMTGLPSGPCRLVVTAHGYPRLERAIDLPESDRPGDITLRDLRLEVELGGQIRGRVRDDRGDPVVGAEVNAGTSDPVRTDSDGRFLIEGVPAGSARVTCKAATESVEVRSNEESRVDLVLPQPR